jgi:hypothetical protein
MGFRWRKRSLNAEIVGFDFMSPEAQSMKSISCFFPLVAVALLIAFLAVPAQATDHPWDDSSTDTSEVLGTDDNDVDNNTEPGEGDGDIITKARIWIFGVWQEFLAIGLKYRQSGELREEAGPRELSRERTKMPSKAWLSK